MIYLVTGQPGTGKSTIAVQHALTRYAAEGRRVVANFPIDFAPVCERAGTALSRASVEVLPDRPSRRDLDALGVGSEFEPYGEDHAGLLIIDEAGVWLSARSWAGQEREAIIDWLSQSRKRRWDIIVIAQGPEMIDKQVRTSICEGVVRIRRLDRVRVLGLRLPRVHLARVQYGLDQNAPVIERWVYRGVEAHKCFGSYRLFGFGDGRYSVLPAMVTKFAGVRPGVDWRYVWRCLLAVVGVGRDGGAALGVVRLRAFGKLRAWRRPAFKRWRGDLLRGGMGA